jgi:hypothetical protein
MTLGKGAHNYDMTRLKRDPVQNALTDLARSATDRVKRWRGHPPEKEGVREPRRPKPSQPGAAVALAEPRTGPHRWIRLTGRRDADRG